MAKILCVNPKNHPFPILSWLIRWVQNKPYSHMAIVNEPNKILDATMKGVVNNNTEDFLAHYNVIKTYELPDMPAQYYDLFKQIFIGREYSIPQNIGFLLKAIGIHKRNVLGEGELKLVCSELAALWIVFTLDIELVDSDQYDLIETEKLCEKYGKLI